LKTNSVSRQSQEKEKVSRISFSLKPQLQKEFDRVSKSLGYDERSKALQIAIQNLINDYELKSDPESSATGTILIIYDHEVRRIDSTLTELGHEHRLVIVSSLHLHLDEENCLNIIVVRGKVKDITALEQSVRKVAGVRQLRSAFLVIGK
jgi:CopG family transcriptional regulator, nickel-responsive regulator